jgi:two-component system, cell cycle response regulator
MLCTVEILGFGATEQKTLATTFVLSLRREVMYSQWFAGHPKPPSLLLIDGDNVQAMQEASSRNLPAGYPVVLVSAKPPEDANCVYAARPIRYLDLFDSLDMALRNTKQFGEGPLFSQLQTSPASAQKNAWARTAAASVSAQLVGPITIYDLSELPQNGNTQVAGSNEQPPVQLPAARNVVSMASSVERPATTRAAAQSRSRQSDAPWVLVVDDSLATRRAMEIKLSQFSINVDYAASGEQAIGLTGTKRYTCVFLDVVLPGMDGYQVCKVIKSTRVYADTRVIMLTSRGGTFDKIRGKMAGCDAYLTKPLDDEKLFNTISKLMPSAVLPADSSTDCAKLMPMQEEAVWKLSSSTSG